MNKTEVLSYDWKDSVHELIADIERWTAEWGCIRSFYSVDTRGDSYVVVISDSLITKQEADNLYAARNEQ